MIRLKLVFWSEFADRVAKSLQPDNLPNMHLQADRESFCLKISAEKIGTMLSTADDLLMNIKIAEETLVSAEER
jgi:hypothetical protein